MVGKHRKRIFVFTRHELLDGRKHNAAGGTVGDLCAQILASAGLHLLLALQVLREREDTKQLSGEVHRRSLHHAGGEAGHGDALAAALRVPDHATLVARAKTRCRDHLLEGRAHRVELMVAGNFLDQRAIILEQDEEAQVPITLPARPELAAKRRWPFAYFGLPVSVAREPATQLRAVALPR